MKRSILIHLAVALLLCVAWTTVVAGNNLTAQLWADYHAHFYQTEKIEYYGDNGIRFGGGDDKFVRLYVRPSLRYHYTERLRFLAGIGVFYTDNQNVANTLEIRPWQGVRFKWPTVGKLTFGNLVRLEERITFTSGRSAFQLRLRYQLGTDISLTRIPWQGLYIPASAELFWDAGDLVDLYSDELRITSGLGYVINESWVMAFVIIVEASQSSLDKSLSATDIIFRFQLKQLLSTHDFEGRVEAPDN
jgi:hypothetical protein